MNIKQELLSPKQISKQNQNINKIVTAKKISNIFVCIKIALLGLNVNLMRRELEPKKEDKPNSIIAGSAWSQWGQSEPCQILEIWSGFGRRQSFSRSQTQ